ncbi:right-handed parallel beta-helix repeat-containing protein [Azorhizophilus paspali]|uniref:mannuronan 5-epimerase n=1 Tax=Azorhizophilus paspali TaxID=69963 RepID=A0ABV6SHC5_AZOPA
MDFDVKDFGAQGDGVSNDRTAIQAAIDAAHAAGGGTVHLPAGEYRVGGGERGVEGALLMKNNVYLAGAGMGQTVIKLLDGWNNDVNGMIRSSGGEETHDFGVRDLTLDGNRDNNPEGTVFGFYTGYKYGTGADRNVLVERVEAREMSGYGFDPHARTINLVIRDSVAHDNGFVGFVADHQIDGAFENNIAYNNDLHGFNVVTSSHDFTLKGNIAYGNGAAGLVVQRGSYDVPLAYNILIDGGSYYDNALEGVLIKLSHDVILQDAHIYNNGTAGVRIAGAQDVQILDNHIHDNVQNGTYPEVLLQAFDDSSITGNVYETLNTLIEDNVITTSGDATYVVQERNDGSDYTTLRDNNISGGQIASVRLSGAHSSSGPLRGTDGDDRLIGGAANEQLLGGDGDDLLDGGAGVDRLTGGDGADIFRFSALDDSYRTASESFVDRIFDFEVGTDRIDLSALGFSGLGNGLDDTLAVQVNSAGTRTYLKSFEANAAGERFEIVLEGNYAGLDESSFIFDDSATQLALVGSAPQTDLSV